MILVDPGVGYCNIISNGDGAVLRVHGNVTECCNQTVRYASTVDNNGFVGQDNGIVVEVSGVGLAYADYLESMGVKIFKFKHRKMGGESLSHCNYFDSWLERARDMTE